jgi:uncharacterized protein (DUF1697 family)
MPTRKVAAVAPRAPQTTHVALLRGINVGGKNKLPMAELSAMFVKAGCAAVRTYIQSGNVIYDAPPRLATAVPGKVEAAIAERFGYRIPVVTRTAADLAAVLAGNPFLARGADPEGLYVVFLAAAPAASRVAALDPNRSPPDELVVCGRDIYFSCPNGIARTRISNAYLDATLATTSTARNWRTVQKLAELSSRDP